MQKKLIALALAGIGASSMALADTNVTLYGILDVNYTSSKTTTNNLRSTSGATADDSTTRFSGLSTGAYSGSRFGVKGSEDLGGGLKAVFRYEFGTLHPDQKENDIDETRQSYVGLAGGFGTFVAGRLNSPAYSWTCDYAGSGAISFGGDYAYSLAKADAGGTQLGCGKRLENAVAWLSPNWGGFTAQVAYSFIKENKVSGSTATGDNKQSAWAMKADYKNGPIGIGLTHVSVGDTDNQATEDGRKETGIGAFYDFGAIKVLGNYSRIKANASDKKGHVWNVGLQAPVGAAGRAYLAYASGSAANVGDATDNEGVEQAADGNSRYYTVGYAHKMSKRTVVYAGWSGGKGGESVNTVGTEDTVQQEKYSGFNLGLRHAF